MAQLCNAMKGGDLATARKLHKELYNLCKMLVELVKLVHHVSVKVGMWRRQATVSVKVSVKVGMWRWHENKIAEQLASAWLECRHVAVTCRRH